MPFKAKTLREKFPYLELFWPLFSTFGLNGKRYKVPFRIQYECGKIRTRTTPKTDTFYAVKTGIAYHMNNTFRHIVFLDISP